ncbi:hypothetical protein ACIP01_11105 [Pseudomonas monteilii]|uniref:hypothetical protein n=1 Tax=Pseudomonas monteilii TaxID=76759 RepID=UPI00382D1BBA
MNESILGRFEGRASYDSIRRAVAVRPDEVSGLSGMDAGVACEVLGNILGTIYLPTEFAIEFIGDMVRRAEQFYLDLFASEERQMQRVYCPPVVGVFPVCLTGLAGVGKSQMMGALLKVMPPPLEVISQHGVVQLCSYWYASGAGKPGPRQVLADFLQSKIISSRGNVSRLIVECRRRVNRDGISLVVLDETQHFNTGAGVTHAVEVILNLSVLGAPTVFATNYSLLHRLLNRNSEDQQRLLRDVRLMLPDSPRSRDWGEYVEEVVRVCAGVMKPTAFELSAELYRLTFGIKRLVVLLVKCAYLEARRRNNLSINMDDIQRAYQSMSYTSSRREVEHLHRAAIEGQSVLKNDLRCPFDLPGSYSSDISKFSRDDRDDRFWQGVMRSALSKTERQILGEIDSSSKLSKPTPKASPKRSVQKPTIGELEEAHRSLVNALKR